MSSPDDDSLDLRGLKCPLPVLRTRKRLKAMREGATLLVECTDPLAAIDIPNLVREVGAHLLEAAQCESVLVFRIRKGA